MIKQNKRVSVFGGRDIQPNIYQDTIEIGKRLADEGYIVFCGGGKGVMEAISIGVKNRNGIVAGLLKGGDTGAVSYTHLTLPTKA